MLTARDVALRVSRLKPGEAIEISRHVLSGIGSSRLVGMFGPSWSPADWIMENIVGSAYEYTSTENPKIGSVTFRHLKQSLGDGAARQTYVSPDRRALFRREGQYWVRLEGVYHKEVK